MIGAHALGGLPQRDASRLRQEIPRRVLGAEPRLDRVAAKTGCLIAARVKRSPQRDTQLPLDQIDAAVIASVTGCSTCSRVFISMK